MIEEMDIRKQVKSLIVKNLLYEIGLKDTKQPKILQEETENLFHNAINNKERPNYLSRSNNSSGFLEEFPKSKFTCLEIGKP
jgi:hypothetical protein